MLMRFKIIMMEMNMVMMLITVLLLMMTIMMILQLQLIRLTKSKQEIISKPFFFYIEKVNLTCRIYTNPEIRGFWVKLKKRVLYLHGSLSNIYKKNLRGTPPRLTYFFQWVKAFKREREFLWLWLRVMISSKDVFEEYKGRNYIKCKCFSHERHKHNFINSKTLWSIILIHILYFK